MFLDELGITESSLDRVIALSYQLLGLISFLTAGPGRDAGPGRSPTAQPRSTRPAPSTPTWPAASSAPRPCPTRTCSTLGSMAEARKAGRLRSEGKTYRVKDGDVIEILFSR